MFRFMGLLLILSLISLLQATLLPLIIFPIVVFLMLTRLSDRLSLLMALMAGICQSLIAGLPMARVSLLYLSWWLILYLLKKRYVFSHVLLFLFVIAVSYLTYVFWMSSGFKIYELLCWMVLGWLVRWWQLRNPSSRDLVLRYD